MLSKSRTLQHFLEILTMISTQNDGRDSSFSTKLLRLNDVIVAFLYTDQVPWSARVCVNDVPQTE
jgi:hypothetical protein